MKVSIGKYPQHRFYHNWLYNIFGIMNEPKVSVKIDKWDTWSMDHTLAHIIVPMLRQLRETTNSMAGVDMEDRPDFLIGTCGDDPCSMDEFAEPAWDWVLTEMIFAFESKFEDWEDQFRSGEHDMQWIEITEGKFKGYSEMVKGPNDTYKVDTEGSKAYQARITNGFRLFGKYYEGLWD